MNSTRTAAFARNTKLEELLTELNSLLADAENQILSQFQQPRLPPVFVVGCPRSGTTLLTQWLAGSGEFAYPSNLISRFYQAPYLGARIQQMLVDSQLAFRHEMTGIDSILSGDYQSTLGKTAGALAPNEFWYFWRRFFPYGEIQHLTDQELANIDVETFSSELAALEAAFNKPLGMKALIANWNLPFLAGVFEKAIFLYIKRQPFFTIQSLLKARQQFFGTEDKWYSFKPPEYDQLKQLNPYEQVGGQVYFTNQAIQQGLQRIDFARWIEIDYEQFCHNPKDIWQQLAARLLEQGYEIHQKYDDPVEFENQNRITTSARTQEAIITAFWKMFQIDITPEPCSVRDSEF